MVYFDPRDLLLGAMIGVVCIIVHETAMGYQIKMRLIDCLKIFHKHD